MLATQFLAAAEHYAMQDKRQVQEGKDCEQDKESGRCLAKYQAIKDKENAQKKKDNKSARQSE